MNYGSRYDLAIANQFVWDSIIRGVICLKCEKCGSLNLIGSESHIDRYGFGSITDQIAICCECGTEYEIISIQRDIQFEKLGSLFLDGAYSRSKFDRGNDQ